MPSLQYLFVITFPFLALELLAEEATWPENGTMWNCELEKEAIEKVRGCPQDVSNAKLEGELRHRVPVKDVQNYEDGIRNAVHDWWSVVRFNDGIGMLAIFRAKHVGQPIATFTQMAWANTSKLGCAIGICPAASESNEQEYVVICRYAPVGNIPDQNVYIPDPPACSVSPLATAAIKMRYALHIERQVDLLLKKLN